MSVDGHRKMSVGVGQSGTSIAQIAETTLGERRLVVRRVRTLDRQGQLLPSRELFPFLPTASMACEPSRPNAGSTPSSSWPSATSKTKRSRTSPPVTSTPTPRWTVIAALAHNLLRWTSVIGLPGQTIRAARTVRRRLLALPGRLTRSARRWTLHLPARWPWHHDFVRALARIRAVPAAA